MASLVASVLLVHLLALASPGPDFFFVTQTAMSRSRAEGLLGAAGIVLGIAVWAALSLLGLQFLFERFAWLQRLIMAAGALYLLWMAWGLLKSAVRKGPDTGHAVRLGNSRMKTFVMGLLTNLANPKALVYFGSVFSLFVEPGQPAAVKWLLFALIAIESLAWFCFVTVVFSLPALQAGYRSAARWIDCAAGVLFAGFSMALAWNAMHG
jgi:threonine efflux protein